MKTTSTANKASFTAMPEKLENAIITGDFEFVFEENWGKEIT